MPHEARDRFVAGLRSLELAVDLSEVRAPDALGDFMRRGLVVSAYSLLETFIAERLEEIAKYINGGATPFLDLPERLQKRATRHVFRVATNQLRWRGSDATSLRDFAREIGASLSTVDRALDLSPLTWLWEGSNMTPAALHSIFRAFHVSSPWQVISALTLRAGSQIHDPEDELNEFMKERHLCAHRASHGVTALWLRTVPMRVLGLAMSFDAMVSRGAHLLRQGDQAFLNNEDLLTDADVALRFIRERDRDFAEYVENRTRAVRRDRDRGSLAAQASGRCAANEVLVIQSRAGTPLEWRIPATD